jgi:hypothetical protein
MAAYGSLVASAKVMGHTDAADMLIARIITSFNLSRIRSQLQFWLRGK